MDRVLWTDADRVGVYFLEFGAAPRPSGIVYDRTDSAMAKVAPGMIDWPTVLSGAKWFYATGIAAALSATSAAATLEALREAKRLGLSTALDPNYRAKLWSVEQAATWLRDAMPFVDVLITNPEDADRFFGVREADAEASARGVATKYGLKAVAMTLRQVHSVWRNGWTALACDATATYRTKSYEVEIVDRLGAGDAFVAGLLHGLLDGDLQKGLDYGTALSALKHAVPGDFVWTTKEEVEGLLGGGGLRIRR